ncbi:hypothetical protein [Variovorax fucosicus]|uniref:hypothetical protein n=1 Tax=Variovorax fucosicus TaxID=3053517 RepID=UPI002575146D|nr:hypothetical protein [Variovorax sp. J22G47]
MFFIVSAMRSRLAMPTCRSIHSEQLSTKGGGGGASMPLAAAAAISVIPANAPGGGALSSTMPPKRGFSALAN